MATGGSDPGDRRPEAGNGSADVPARPKRSASGSSQAHRITARRAPRGIWLDCDVLACACPDCGAPMSIRIWLMLADCWRCGASVELTEEQEREALRLLDERDSRPAAIGRETSGPATVEASAAPEPPAAAPEPAPAAIVPPPPPVTPPPAPSLPAPPAPARPKTTPRRAWEPSKRALEPRSLPWWLVPRSMRSSPRVAVPVSEPEVPEVVEGPLPTDEASS